MRVAIHVATFVACLAGCTNSAGAPQSQVVAPPLETTTVPEPITELGPDEENERNYGKFVHTDLVVNDPTKAAEFYEQLLSWTVTAQPSGDLVISNQGQPLSRIRKFDPSGPIPAGWMSYISVEDVDDLMRDVPANGGMVLVAPKKAKEGQVAVLKGSTGGVFGVVQLSGDAESDKVTQIGDFVLSQLWTSNFEKALSFYSVMGDYTSEHVQYGTTRYSILKAENVPRAIIRKTPTSRSNRWIPFVRSDDVDGLVRKAKKLGAKIITPPRVVPILGRLAVIEAPTGGVIGFITPDTDESQDW